MMAAETALKSLVVPALTKHTATVIFIHGLGDTGHGWKPVAEMFNTDPDLSHVKWVLPHAPARPVTGNFGMVMPSWYDIYSFDAGNINTQEDENGLLSSSGSLNRLISAEVDGGIEANRIVIGGFSQGGVMSLLTGLTSERKLAGVAVLSGYLPLRKTFKSLASDHAKSTPVFWGHGTADPLVRYELGTKSFEYLKSALGMPVANDNEICGIRFNSYEGVEHGTSPEELMDLKTWLKTILPKGETRL